jgi:hypothetical protein
MRDRSVLALLALVFCACGVHRVDGPEAGAGQDGAPAVPGLIAIDVVPAEATLVVQDGRPAQSQFKATGHFQDGAQRDVTTEIGWTIDEQTAMVDAPGHAVANGQRAGTAILRARAGAVEGTAHLIVRVAATRLAGGATASDADRFGGAADGSRAPAIVYPPEGVLVPPNLGSLEVQWQPSGGTDVYELAIQSDYLDLHLVTTEGRMQLTSAEWLLLSSAHRGGQVALRVRAAARAGGGVGTSADRHLLLAEMEVQGGLYYWSTLPPSDPRRPNVEGIWRFDFGRSDGMPEKVYGQTDPPQLCVGCHVLSRDGAKMGVAYSYGDPELHKAGFLRVTGRAPYVGIDRGIYASFSTFNPDASRIVTTSRGVLTLRNGTSGASLGTIATGGGRSTMPDWSADGRSLVFVHYNTTEYDWQMSGGSLMIADWNGQAFGTPRMLVAAQGTENNYYPQFSPDGRWILFNRVTGGSSYNNPLAQVWVVASDGSTPPVSLTQGGGAIGKTNSWPRWSPFVQTYKGSPLLWITVSSTRAYGNELPDGGSTPQMWMFAFDPTGARSGSDPSWPAFWLPFQSLASDNHIAQWTTRVVPQ